MNATTEPVTADQYAAKCAAEQAYKEAQNCQTAGNAAGYPTALTGAPNYNYDPAEEKVRQARYEQREDMQKKLNVFGALLQCRPGLDPAEAAKIANEVYKTLSEPAST